MIKIHLMLSESELKSLHEIGDGSSKSFPWQNKFYAVDSNSFFTMFLAPIANDISDTSIPRITVGFHNIGDSKFEVSFLVNEDDIQAFKAPTKYYLQLLSTVLKIIKEFVKKYQPSYLEIEGADKSDVQVIGQKNRIYFAFLEKNADSMGYRYGHKSNKLVLIKK